MIKKAEGKPPIKVRGKVYAIDSAQNVLFCAHECEDPLDCHHSTECNRQRVVPEHDVPIEVVQHFNLS